MVAFIRQDEMYDMRSDRDFPRQCASRASSGPEDLCKHRRVGRLLDGVELNLVDNEANANGGVCGDYPQVKKREKALPNVVNSS